MSSCCNGDDTIEARTAQHIWSGNSELLNQTSPPQSIPKKVGLHRRIRSAEPRLHVLSEKFVTDDISLANRRYSEVRDTVNMQGNSSEVLGGLKRTVSLKKKLNSLHPVHSVSSLSSFDSDCSVSSHDTQISSTLEATMVVVPSQQPVKRSDLSRALNGYIPAVEPVNQGESRKRKGRKDHRKKEMRTFHRPLSDSPCFLFTPSCEISIQEVDGENTQQNTSGYTKNIRESHLLHNSRS